ncbi:fimbrial protein [Franconibacter pulveris 1160]|jgi:type 1 fimbria pilin|nr:MULTISPECIES: fimbrial protein [Franconibacter]MCK1967353.1 fimbrial protein [Franconibacter sp. IITDAS19]
MMKFIRYFFSLCLLASSLLFIPHANAACSTRQLPMSQGIYNLTISTSTEIGDVIAGTERAVNFNVSCTTDRSGEILIACFNGSGEEVPGMPGVYATGIAGIGVTLYNDQWKRVTGKGENCDSRNTPIYKLDSNKSFMATTNLALVKTAEQIGEGNLNSANSSFVFKIYNAEKIANNSTAYYNVYLSPNTVSCSVDPKSLVVNLGDIPASQFTGPGTATPWHNFDVNISCDRDTMIQYRITGAEGIMNGQQDVMKLDDTPDSATGIGIQMQVNNATINYFSGYYPPLSLTDKRLTLPAGIRYYQTSHDVTPGSANAAVIITIAYQ